MFGYKNYGVGFKFIQLGNWLLDNNLEFREKYKDFASRTPPSVQITYIRQRIQRHLDILIKIGLLRIKSRVRAEKNDSMTPLYDVTVDGFLLACLLNFDSATYPKIISLLESISKRSDSSLIRFVLLFFRKCEKIFGSIVSHYVNFVLPTIDSGESKDILLSFLGVKCIVNWVLFHKRYFYQALLTLDELDRINVMFEIKMEIENYYSENYLKTAFRVAKINSDGYVRAVPSQTENAGSRLEEFSKTIGLAPMFWQKVRMEHAKDVSKLIVPGSCIMCKSDKAVIVDFNNYLNSIQDAYGPDPSWIVSGRCSECGGYASGNIIQLKWFTCAWN